MNNRMVLLGVNIDHVATIRQARRGLYPEPVQAALVAEQAGADGITAHLREDRRHIQDRDLFLLKDMIRTRLNMEMAVTDAMVAIAVKLKPYACCLVPEKREELTTEGGLDVVANFSRVQAATEKLKEAGIEVSLFIDPEEAQIDAAVKIGAPVVELHTGSYAEARYSTRQKLELARIGHAAAYAHTAGLQVNAGHGLDCHNVAAICTLPEIVELNIGYSIIAQALFSGLAESVRNLKHIMQTACKHAN